MPAEAEHPEQRVTEATIAISTHTLAPGTYVLQLYKDGADAGKQLFVKD